jgi:hypothetical protein
MRPTESRLNQAKATKQSMKGPPMKTQLLSALLLALPWLAIAAEPKSPNEITGTWIAKRTTPMGDMEAVYDLKTILHQ